MYSFPNFNDRTVEVWERIRNFIPPFKVDGCNYSSMLGFKLIHVCKKGPRWKLFLPFDAKFALYTVVFYAYCKSISEKNFINYVALLISLSTFILDSVHWRNASVTQVSRQDQRQKFHDVTITNLWNERPRDFKGRSAGWVAGSDIRHTLTPKGDQLPGICNKLL